MEALPKNGNTVVYVTHADSEAISDQFTYEAVVDDNEGTKIKDIASVEISIQQDAVVVPPTEPEVTNNVPTANAGSDVSVEVNMPITLIGSASSDSDGSIVAYEWKEGNTVLSTDMTFDYTPTTVETHTILLTVTDDDSATGTDEVVVTATEPEAEVTNKVPMANAGSDVSVEVNMPITLTGSASSDSDGSIVAYEWKEGSTVLSTDMSFDYTPTTVETHTILLTVTDDDSAMGTDEVVVTATEPEDVPNTKPVAYTMAIEMDNCQIGNVNNPTTTFTLTGHDDDGDSLTFTKVSEPTYGSIIINEDTGKGKYWLNNSEDQGNCWEGTPNSFTFKVNDSTVDSDSATVTVTLDSTPS